MRSRALAAATTGVLAVLAAAGCSGTGADPAPPADPGAGPVVVPEGDAQRCENEELGIAVTFPADWHTNPGDVYPACLLFDPSPLDRDDEGVLSVETAVTLSLEDADYTDLIEPDPYFEDVLAQETVTVAGGRSAIRAEARARATSTIPDGTLSYRYYVDLGETQTLVAETFDAGDLDFEAKKRVLDELMASLEVTG